MFKTLLTALTLASVTTPALAETPHQSLYRAVRSVGVEIRVNEYNDCDPGVTGSSHFGWYSGRTRTLVICQEEAIRRGHFDGTVFDFTQEDLDTLRHEAHHLVQDCMDRVLDHDLDTVYKTPIEFALKVMGRDKSQRVFNNYKDKGAHVVTLELEAFAVAQLNDPIEQVSDINTYCF